MDNANPLVSAVALPTRRRRDTVKSQQDDGSIFALWDSVLATTKYEEGDSADCSSGSERDFADDVEDPIDSQEVYGQYPSLSGWLSVCSWNCIFAPVYRT
jgi:hypothetical protein